MSDAATSGDGAAGEAAPRGVAALFARFDALPLELFLFAFLRITAVIWLATGLVHWARIVGYAPWRGEMFGDMPIEWQSAIVFYAVLDLVAAVGLWLAASWGVTVWLFAIACQIFTHSALSEIFGERPFRIPFYVLSVLVYALLWWRLRHLARVKAAEDGF